MYHAAIQRKQENRASHARRRQKKLVVVRESKVVDPKAGADRSDQRAVRSPQLDGGVLAGTHEKSSVRGVFERVNFGGVAGLHGEFDGRGWGRLLLVRGESRTNED